MSVYIGLDVHSKTTTFTAMDDQGTTLAQGKVPTTRDGLLSIRAKLKDHAAPLRCALETGTMAKWTYRTLTDLGFEAVVIDAHEVRAKARRVGQKSDSRDAFELCDGLRRGLFVSRVFMPPPDIEALRLTISRRRHFVRLRSGQAIAAKHLLRAAGLGALGKGLTTEAAWKKLLAH